MHLIPTLNHEIKWMNDSTTWLKQIIYLTDVYFLSNLLNIKYKQIILIDVMMQSLKIKLSMSAKKFRTNLA